VRPLPALNRGVGLAQFERALRYPSQTLIVTRFSVGLLIALVLLGGLGYVIGHGPSGASGSVLHALTDAAGRTGVSVALALPCMILAGWCLRRLWLQYLAWLPGTIQVPLFECACELAGGVTAEQLTTQFRNTLSTLRLQTDAPSPGAQPPSDFLDVLSKDSALQGSAASPSIAQVAAFVRAVFPPTALEVRGTLVSREDPSGRCCGVSLRVTRLPDQGSLLEDVWAKDWPDAMRRAADSAIAAILSRTRLCKGPWVTWRGYVMNPVVLGAYEDAARFDVDRRYYAALRCCYGALEHDPLNRAIRLQLGKLQEQLGLYLEALGTYRSILLAGRPAGRRLPFGLYRPRARRERRRQADIARYRQIVLLSGNSVAEQWYEVRRRAGEDPYRQEMRGLLQELCAQPLDLDTCSEDELSRALCERARKEAGTLRWSLRGWRLIHFERNQHLLARTVAVTEARIRERLASLDPGRTPPSASTIDTRIEEIDGRLRRCARWTGLRSYQSNYNAACLYALPLKDEYRERTDEDRRARRLLAQRAVQQLQLAAAFADSAFLASRRNWLISEDPDLQGLRDEPEFATFVSTYFPMPATAEHRWIATTDLAALYTYELLRSMAPIPAAGWDRRAKTPATERDGRTLAHWWRSESTLWQAVSSVAANPADWRSHLSLLDTLGAWSSEFLAPRSHRLAPEQREGERIKRRLPSLGDLLLRQSAAILPPPAGTIDPKPVWLTEHAHSISDHDFDKVCQSRAKAWSQMDAYLGAAEANADQRLNDFTRAIADLESDESSWELG